VAREILLGDLVSERAVRDADPVLDLGCFYRSDVDVNPASSVFLESLL